MNENLMTSYKMIPFDIIQYLVPVVISHGPDLGLDVLGALDRHLYGLNVPDLDEVGVSDPRGH